MTADPSEPAAAQPAPLVFLLDVDNTLLDNDRFLADFRSRIEHDFGREHSERYWKIIETHRVEAGYVDYLGAIQLFRYGLEDNPRLLELAAFATEYPFADCLFPGTLDVLAELATQGTTVILSDGDIVFQPRKIRRSGIWDAVAGRVLIRIHKQNELEPMMAAFPARHYVMIDDKVEILSAMKRTLGERLTTVFVRQGHYARKALIDGYDSCDIEVDRIGDLHGHDWAGIHR